MINQITGYDKFCSDKLWVYFYNSPHEKIEDFMYKLFHDFYLQDISAKSHELLINNDILMEYFFLKE